MMVLTSSAAQVRQHAVNAAVLGYGQGLAPCQGAAEHVHHCTCPASKQEEFFRSSSSTFPTDQPSKEPIAPPAVLTHSVACFNHTGTDHHFHFGYWVSAAAAVASQDLQWYKQHLEPAVKSLIRDYANNDAADPLLPFARHKDFYMGHSWASGLQLSQVMFYYSK
jgi:hypothetical protein